MGFAIAQILDLYIKWWVFKYFFQADFAWYYYEISIMTTSERTFFDIDAIKNISTVNLHIIKKLLMKHLFSARLLH